MILLLILLYLTIGLAISILNKSKFNVLACGLAGYSGDVPYDKDKMSMLLLYNESRGEDSFGIFNGSILRKRLGAVSMYGLPKDFINLKPSKFVIAHTRAKTKGAVNIENAHPFYYGNTIMAHNGTLTNWHHLKNIHEVKEDFDVDSQVICYLLDKYKNEKVLTEIKGAAALLYARSNSPNTLFVFRTEERPLFRGTIKKDGSTQMYISSLATSLSAIGCSNIVSFDTNRLYTIKNGKIEKTTKIAVNNKEVSMIPFDYTSCRGVSKNNTFMRNVREAINSSEENDEKEELESTSRILLPAKYNPDIRNAKNIAVAYVEEKNLKSSGKIDNILNAKKEIPLVKFKKEETEESLDVLAVSNLSEEGKFYIKTMLEVREELISLGEELNPAFGTSIFDYKNIMSNTREKVDFLSAYIEDQCLEICKSCES